MKIFPIKKYSIELITDTSKAISELQKETLSGEQFVSDWNKQTFIGKINKSDFDLKLSKKLYGGLCFFKGKLDKENGTLEIGINKTFKIISLFLFLFPVFGFLVSLIKNGFKNTIELLFPTILFIIILRFVFIELGFRIVSKNGLNKLTEIIGIEKIKTWHNTV